jgi:hypothetical protein
MILDLKKTGCEGGRLREMAQDRVQSRVLLLLAGFVIMERATVYSSLSLRGELTSW